MAKPKEKKKLKKLLLFFDMDIKRLKEKNKKVKKIMNFFFYVII